MLRMQKQSNAFGMTSFRRRSPLSSMGRLNYERHIKRLEKYVAMMRAESNNRNDGLEILSDVRERLRKCQKEIEALTVLYNEARKYLVQLSRRENEVYSFVKAHPEMVLKQVASEMGVSISTVKFHLGGVYRKIGIENRAQL